MPKSPELIEHVLADRDATIVSVWRERIARTPDAPFLRSQGESWTYAEAWQEILRYAGCFRELGCGVEERRVASLLANRPECYWAWFGALVAGAGYVSLNRMHKGPVLEDMAGRSRATILVTEQNVLEHLNDLAACGFEKVILVDGEADAKQSVNAEWIAASEIAAAPSHDAARPLASDLAVVLYTSGTTGRSKAVRLPHHAYARGAARFAEIWELTASDVTHAWLPLFHIAGQLHISMGTIVCGGTIALYPTLSISRFWEEVAESGATNFVVLPNVVNLLLKREPAPDDGDNSLRVGGCTSLPEEQKSAFEDRFGVTLLNQLGMTEAELLTMPVRGTASPPASCGKTGPDFDLRIVDEQDREMPLGETGEIVIRPRLPNIILQGYEGDEAATLRAFRNLWFHTGDLGYVDAEGWVYWVDRMKDRIRRRGENVSSWEIEQILLAHPAVNDGAAVAVPSPFGEDDIKIVVMLKPEARATPAELHAYCAENMARFMVPRYIEIADMLPYNQTNKIQKELLKTLGEHVWDAEGQ